MLLLKLGKRGKEKVHKRYETKVKDWEKTNLVTTTTTTGENHFPITTTPYCSIAVTARVAQKYVGLAF